jgi:heme oxygenase
MNRSSTAACDTDVLAALRTATASRHERLDSGLPLSAPAPSLADYAAHLRMVRDWLLPLQAWLDGHADGPRAEASLAPTGRLALIDADLREPGMPTVLPVRASSAWPDGASPAYRWGVAYVIEGSQLGGAVLHARLATPLAPHPLRYLRGEGGPGPRWRAFMIALRAAVQSPQEIIDACAGACTAFDSILELAPLRK